MSFDTKPSREFVHIHIGLEFAEISGGGIFQPLIKKFFLWIGQYLLAEVIYANT